ncbi:MAG: hypothetical protein ACTSXP_12765 [Promethearchaeota archaeon]
MKAMECYLPQPIITPDIPMKCANCNAQTTLFLTSCPECKARMIPLEIVKYQEFKQVIEAILEEGFLQEFLSDEAWKHVITSHHDKIEDYSTFSFTHHYLKYYILDFSCDLLSRYLDNFRRMLALDFLHKYHDYLQREIYSLRDQIGSLDQVMKKSRAIRKNLAYYATSDSLYIFKKLYQYWSELSLEIRNDDPVKTLASYLMIGALSEILSELNKLGLRESSDQAHEKYREFILEFILDKGDKHALIPSYFHMFIDKPEMLGKLVQHEIDLLFLPKHDRYVLVKHSFNLGLDAIERLVQEKGGINIKDVALKLNVTPLTAEVILQVLLRKKMVVKTSSYLHGDRFYLK